MGKSTWAIGIVSLAFISSHAFGLDYEREIRRQERSVKIQYQAPPKTLASFLKHYPQCREHRGKARLKCNQTVAKERYISYFHAWRENRRRVVSSVETGELNVQLEKRAR